jgi:hypothetical protein
MKKKRSLGLIPLNLLFIFFAIAILSHNYTYAWRGVLIVVGISLVVGVVLKVFAKPN